MGLEQGTGSFIKASQQYLDQIMNHRTNLFGKAQQMNDQKLSDAEYDKYMDQVYKPGGDLGAEGKDAGRAPAKIASPADIAKLPPGKKYLIPTGMPGAGQTAYAVQSPTDIASLPHGAKFIIPDGSGTIATAP